MRKKHRRDVRPKDAGYNSRACRCRICLAAKRLEAAEKAKAMARKAPLPREEM